jgi:peptide/nickel transport system substrate-binding protein
MFNNDNVDLPSLNPWILTTPGPSERYVFVRNPYFHCIDESGQQLPYVDRVVFTVAAANLIPAKGSGESCSATCAFAGRCRSRSIATN